jgi:hypothetical protein
MFNEFNTYSTNHTRGASEIEMYVREQEKKMSLMKAIYHSDATNNHGTKQKGTRNPFRALLGIFLAGF